MDVYKPHIKTTVLHVYDNNFIHAEDVVKSELNKWPCQKAAKKLYNTCPICLDTETTTVNDFAFIYIFQLQVGNYTLLFRTKNLMLKILKIISTYCYEDECSQIYLGIANTKYEWSFLCKDFKDTFTEKFEVYTFLEKCCPLTAVMGQLIVVDILRMSGTNLAKTGENFCTTQKMKGDLDYKVIRNSKTPLTQEELQYCINDVVVGAEYIMYLHNRYTENGKKIPLTSTGVVRSIMKEEAYRTKTVEKDGKKVSEYVYKEVLAKVKDGFPATYSEYAELMEFLFRGGYTHGNVFYAGELLKDIEHVDYTSDYPACMLQELYPTQFVEVLEKDGKLLNAKSFTTKEHLEILTKKHKKLAWYGKITLTNVKAKYDHSLESINKIVEYTENDCTIDNGRILKCKEMTVWLTEQDFICYKKIYNFEVKKVENLKLSIKEPLPWYVIKAVVESYRDKKILKDKGLPYALEKSILNSCYGCTVQRINIEETKDVITDETIRTIKSPVPFKYLDTEDDKNMKYFDWIVEALQKKYNYGLKEKEDKLRTYLIKIYSDIEHGNVPLEFQMTEKYRNCYNMIVQKLQQRAYKAEINGSFGQSKMLSCWWGIWVTAYARCRLISMIAQLEEYALEKHLKPIVVYCDTDSMFVNWQNDNKIKEFIEEYNKETEEFNIATNRHFNAEGLLDDIGLFTWEPTCTHFKQLGAKRYVQRFKKKDKYIIESTIAGLNKEDFSKKISTIQGSIKHKFDFFDDGMIIEEYESSKLTPMYIHEEYSTEVTDDYGNTEIMTERCGQVLREVGFEMTVFGLIKDKLGKRVG